MTNYSQYLADAEFPTACDPFRSALVVLFDKVNDEANRINSWVKPPSRPTNASILAEKRTLPEYGAQVKAFDLAVEALDKAKADLGMATSEDVKRQTNPHLAQQTILLDQIKGLLLPLVQSFGLSMDVVNTLDALVPTAPMSDGRHKGFLTDTYSNTLAK